MGGKQVQILHLEGEMRQVRPDYYRPGGWVTADFDEFLALWRLEKHQLGTPGGAVSGDLLEAKDPPVKIDGALKVFNAVTGVEESGDHGLLFFGLPVWRSLWTMSDRVEGYKAAHLNSKL
jgi:hypothetical protein